MTHRTVLRNPSIWFCILGRYRVAAQIFLVPQQIRMKWMLCWLVSFLLFLNRLSGMAACEKECQINIVTRLNHTECCMKYTHEVLRRGSLTDTIEAIKTLENVLERTAVDESVPVCVNDFVALLHKPKGTFGGLKIYASENQVNSDVPLLNTTVSVQLPRELNAGRNNKIVFCMFKWPATNRSIFESPYEVYDRRLVGLSVQDKKISGLLQCINITVKVTKEINKTQTPSCQFFNFSTQNFSSDGCLTHWTRGQSNITCSCDHLTYFAVLMVSTSTSPKDQKILTYITAIGCSLSLIALVIAVLLFITNRKLRQDVSMKVHVNLVIALILLNLHFLPSQTAAAGSSDGLCFYVALALHYSLLATFSWMALEGFHIYLLLVKVFNIYVKRYLLKLSVVGWGVPAVILSVVMMIDRKFYGRGRMNTSNSNDTAICYITNDTVRNVTTVGLFCLVFLFNTIMFGVTAKRVLIHCITTKFGPHDHDRAKKDICALLGVMTLLGITWGLIFFSFGSLTTPVLYLFCILNSLQGFFIFLWFVRKVKTSATKMSSETQRNTS